MPPHPERYLTDSLVPPRWVTGHISYEDGRLLEDLVRRRVRRPIIEVGVASGWSSAVLLNALNHTRPSSSADIWLHSYDVAEWCYFDASRRVGAAVGEVVPQFIPYWKLHIGNAVQAGREWRGSGTDLAFIDADHRHPWATLDLLGLLPALAQDGWVALHDINLPNVASKPEWRVFGPKHLFDLWPWEKCVAAGDKKNIGAIRLPGDERAVRVFCDTVLALPWEAPVPSPLLEEVGVSGKEGYWVEDGRPRDQLLARLRAVVDEGRALVLWGAGSAGIKFLQQYPEFRDSSKRFIDSGAQKHGTTIEGLRVEPPEFLWSLNPRPFVCITSQFAGEILQSLEKQGFRASDDYLTL